MSKEYICTGCGARYLVEDLADNAEGICDYCDCPLVPLDKGAFSYLTPLNRENIEVNKMICELRQYPMDGIWKDIEKQKDPKTRLKFRGHFFKALKVLGKQFELWDT